MRIYTKTGDLGETGLFGGERVYKDDLRVTAYGTVDELNAVLGIAIALQADPELDTLLLSFQNDLFMLGSDLATPEEEDRNKGRIQIARVPAEKVEALEHIIDKYEATLPPLTRFILPGGTPLSAQLHFARTVCRRAERACVTLHRATTEAGKPAVNPEIVRYLNRLSDLLFVLARAANHRSGKEDIPWNP